MARCAMIRPLRGVMGDFRAKHAGQRSRTVREDWFCLAPRGMDQLFGATRSELECSNGILSLPWTKRWPFANRSNSRSLRKGHSICGLFDRLAVASPACDPHD